jgi:iron-sulfur cluster assembly protein
MITVTTSALENLRKLISARENKPQGIRVGITTKGCSGMSYSLEYVDELVEGDEIFDFEDVKIFVDPKASLFLIGTQMDYVKGELESGFKFINPNEKGRCGCGESFHV